MKALLHSKSILKLLFSAALLAVTTARAQGPMGWDVEHEQPWEGTLVIHYGPPQDPDYPVQRITPAETNDEYLAGGGSGEPRVDEPLHQDSAEFVGTL